MGWLDERLKRSDRGARELLEQAFSLFVAVVAAIVGYFLGWYITEQTIHELDGREVQIFSYQAREGISISFCLLFLFLGYIATEHIKFIINRRREKEAFLDLFNEKLEERLGKMIEHSAFFTENGKLEGIIQLLKNTRGRKKWIIAKFISKQLSDTFLADFTINIDGHGYSTFAESLYQECEESIYLTSPFTPEEWFRQLIPEDKIRRIEQGLRGILSEYETPAHVRALSASPAAVKRRLVILPGTRWSELEDPAKVGLLKEFLRVNKDVDTRFIKQEDLWDKLGFNYEEKCDYAIFDKRLLLKWERPSNGRDKRPLCLYTEVPESYRRLSELFDYGRNGIFYEDGRGILTAIKERQKGG